MDTPRFSLLSENLPLDMFCCIWHATLQRKKKQFFFHLPLFLSLGSAMPSKLNIKPRATQLCSIVCYITHLRYYFTLFSMHFDETELKNNANQQQKSAHFYGAHEFLLRFLSCSSSSRKHSMFLQISVRFVLLSLIFGMCVRRALR